MKVLALLFLFFFPPSYSSGQSPHVADQFHGIDFSNRSLPYRFSWGKQIQLALKNGNYEYDFQNERGWFRLENVYVTDVGGDKRPEAIVMLWHVACGVSCDGGSALFYIYSFDRGRLKPVWTYETGNLAYGCGLKSFSANRSALTVELFSWCSKQNRVLNETLTGKFQVKGTTRVTFKSNGVRFVARKRDFFPSAERSVINYEPQIHVGP